MREYDSLMAARLFYDHVVGQQLEGVVAKWLASRYLRGRRTGAWIKINVTSPHVDQQGQVGPISAPKWVRFARLSLFSRCFVRRH